MVVCAAIGLYIGLYLINVPGSVARDADRVGSAAVPRDRGHGGAKRSAPHVGLLLRGRRQLRNWRHDTTFVLPANTLVHVTIYQYDTATGLRNPFLVAGRPGRSAARCLLDGKPTQAIDPDDAASHVSRSRRSACRSRSPGVRSNAKNLCSNAPVLAEPRRTTRSRSRSARPARACTAGSASCRARAGFIQGNGGPMQTVGYMDGFIKVV